MQRRPQGRLPAQATAVLAPQATAVQAPPAGAALAPWTPEMKAIKDGFMAEVKAMLVAGSCA